MHAAPRDAPARRHRAPDQRTDDRPDQVPALRHRLTKPGTAEPPNGSVELTCARDGLTHRVDEPAYTAGLAGRRGIFRAVCGAVVLAGSLVTPPGRRCPTCADVVQLWKDTARDARRPG